MLTKLCKARLPDISLDTKMDSVIRRREEQSLKLALGSHGYEVLATSFSQPWHMMQVAGPLPHCLIFPLTVLIIAELARGHRWGRNFEPNFFPGRDLIKYEKS